MRKQGRPPKRGDASSERITLRFTPAQKAIVLKALNSTGRTTGDLTEMIFKQLEAEGILSKDNETKVKQ